MREFRAKAIINATAEDVFRTLVDPEAHLKFDPNCENIRGTFKQGRVITIISKQKPTRLSARVSMVKVNDMMIWEFGWPFNLWKSVRTFKVIAKDDQTTEFQLSEIQTGYLLRLLAHRLQDPSLAFQQFAKGLKKFIESRPLVK